MIWLIETVGLSFAGWQALGIRRLYRNSVWKQEDPS